MRLSLVTVALLLPFCASPKYVHAQGGHGPVFGLATPTLPEGAWNVDITGMSVARDGRGAMLRETIRYGVTRDVQLNVSIPQQVRQPGAALNTRVGTMMGGMNDAEISLFWRPHVAYPGVGRRVESTIILSGLYRVVEGHSDVDAGTGIHWAVVTGYASRSVYAWVGGGYQRHFMRSGDRPGDLGYVSAVIGWRPPVFRGDYPKPDWRVFIESLAEFVGRDRMDGESVEDRGGNRLLLGPSVLGLYGKWGLGTGLLFPVLQRSPSGSGGERARVALNLSYWL